MRSRLNLTYQFALLAAVALLVVLGLGVFDLSDRAQTNAVMREQGRLLGIKRLLEKAELQALNSRLAETQMRLTRKAALYGEFVEHMGQVDSVVALLGTEFRGDQINESFGVLQTMSSRYQRSVKTSLAVQEKMGLGNQRGLLSELRALQDTIQLCLEPIEASQLIFQFSRLLLLEKDFSSTLNMKLADQLLIKADDLVVAIRARGLSGPEADKLVTKLGQYRTLASQLVSATVELELATAENALHFNRIPPQIARCQVAVDQRFGASAEELLEQRRVSFLRTVAIFAIALLIIAGLMLWQIRSARALAMRLEQLAEGMREVAAGHFAKVAELPQGQDEVGQLGTTFKVMATQIQAQILTIQQEREKAEIANRVKSQFLTTMSHEIRTPLNAVLGMLELLENTDLNQSQREYASTSRTSAEGLMTLLNDILDLSRIEAEKLELEQAPFSLQAVIGQTVALFSPRAREKGLGFDHFVDRQIPPRLVGDANRIRQLLANLVGNAIKFTETGQVKVAAQRIEGNEQEVEIHLAVQDTGPGIAAEYRDRLFEPFTQADASTTRKYGGSGLGLSICARLVELMGGRIWLESEEGKGATFCFSLTLQVPSSDEMPIDQEAVFNIPGDMAERMPLSILLVDDIDTNRQMALEVLAKMGYDADGATNGFEAIEQTQNKAYDLVFMDIQMPGMDGIEATRIILRNADSSRRPRIIAVSGHALQKDQEACREAGMDDFISKPFRPRQLYGMVSKWGQEQAPSLLADSPDRSAG